MRCASSTIGAVVVLFLTTSWAVAEGEDLEYLTTLLERVDESLKVAEEKSEIRVQETRKLTRSAHRLSENLAASRVAAQALVAELRRREVNADRNPPLAKGNEDPLLEDERDRAEQALQLADEKWEASVAAYQACLGEEAEANESMRIASEERLNSMQALSRMKAKFVSQPSEELLAEIEEKALASVPTELISTVTWKSVPASGATIWYQTKRGRERGDAATSISNPTTTTEEVRVGRYHVWAQRGDRVTSDRDRLYRIVKKRQPITIDEFSKD